MKLLALDTSSIACSVALQCGDSLYERHEEQPREHTRILLPMIQAAIAEAGVAMQDLDAIVLGNGPGSFIGMRIAASVAQGLAYASGVGIVPVSSLLAVAAEVLAGDAAADEVVVAQDAHMNEVYLGLFARGPGGVPVERAPERLAKPVSLSQMLPPPSGRRVAAGYGWQRYPELLDANRDGLAGVTDSLHPRARWLLAAGAARLSSDGSLPPQAVSPAYLRHKVAEKPREAP